MSIAELIERLRQFPSDMTVTVDGYEGGVTEDFAVEAIYIEPNVNRGQSFVGEHAAIVLGPDERLDEYEGRAPVLHITRSPYMLDVYVKVAP